MPITVAILAKILYLLCIEQFEVHINALNRCRLCDMRKAAYFQDSLTTVPPSCICWNNIGASKRRVACFKLSSILRAAPFASKCSRPAKKKLSAVTAEAGSTSIPPNHSTQPFHPTAEGPSPSDGCTMLAILSSTFRTRSFVQSWYGLTRSEKA
jgi:hypothetical protein